MGREEKEREKDGRGRQRKRRHEVEGDEREREQGGLGERIKEKAKELSFTEPGYWLLSFCLLF